VSSADSYSGRIKNLYVVNAYFEYSQVLKFNGTLNENGQHDFAEVFVKRHAEVNPGIDHPFNVAFGAQPGVFNAGGPLGFCSND
jgi:hypothetical protein